MPKIAIIEDEQQISQMYRLKFEAEGWEVYTAEDGIKGLELCEKIRPDIVLLDIMMPEMNGDEMLAKLRDTDHGSSVIVIILTNRGDTNLPEKLQKMGITDFIVKADKTPRQVFDIVKDNIG